MAELTFPTTLTEFGYKFNAEGKLCTIDKTTGVLTNDSFEFCVSEDPKYNQKRYEALGDIINEYVYELLEEKGLKRQPLPKGNNTPQALKSFIFGSEGALEKDKIIVFMHGSGVVRAGQWARRLIINDSLMTGTQIPYIEKAKELGYGIFVLNTNDNVRMVNGRPQKIKGSGDPHEHLDTAWTDYIGRCRNAKSIAIVAHSYGGECAVRFAKQHPDEFEKKVFAVALTDSVHIAPSGGVKYILKVARNWACSNKPLDTPLPSVTGDIERVSAGDTVHEMSSASCMESVFAFLEERFTRINENQ